MSDDLKELRDLYQSDLDDWGEAREARAKDMRALAGDPWSQADRKMREDAGRPCLTFDELSQHVNQVVNDFRANPLSVLFAPGPPITASGEVIKATEKASELYGDAMREMEYRCNASEVYTTAAENAVQGGYGFTRLVSEFIPGSFEQRLALKSVPDPNTVIPNWDFQSPDLSDMRRCFVLEPRPIKDFKRDFPNATITDFEGYAKEHEYRNWVQEDKILLAEAWSITREPVKLLLIQLPAVQPPTGGMGLRPPADRPPLTIKESEWPAWQAKGARFIRAREDTTPKVVQKLINGVEVLKETTWPGPHIPIAGCMGRILYTDDGGTSKRLLLSAIRLALEPFLAYCFCRTSEVETMGMITKNPYWAYAGQVTADQQNRIAQSMHEPVALLEANPTTTETGQQILPLPIRNPQSLDLSMFSIGAEEFRRGILSALGESALPTSAQRNNEKSKVALDKIEQSRQKGTYHFFDHYKGMVCHVGRLFEAAFDTFHDTSRQIPTRKRDETAAEVWINNPQREDAIDVRGSYMVTVSAGPHVDSTRQAASDFADSLLGSEMLVNLLGPQKAQQIAALAVKLKVKQTGIGAIGEEIAKIIDPPQEGDEQTSEQLMQQNAELQGQLQQAMQMLEQAAKEKEAGLAKEQAKTERDTLLTEMEHRFGRMLQAMKGEQAKELQAMKDAAALRKQNDAQAHDAGLTAADAAAEREQAELASLAALAKPAGGNGNGAGANA